ncbi:hypothetical protein ES703_28389 [subsurface metagenome]
MVSVNDLNTILDGFGFYTRINKPSILLYSFHTFSYLSANSKTSNLSAHNQESLQDANPESHQFPFYKFDNYVS